MSSANSQRTMSFWEHLAELRWRLFICALALVAGAGVAYVARLWIYGLLVEPLLRAAPGIKLNYFSPVEPFFVYMRLALFGGVVLASPVVLYQLWAFIAPALTRRERRLAAPVVPLILLLFICGVLFVYFVLLPFSLQFLLGLAPVQAEPELSQERYFGFITALCLAGGILFELPAALGLLGWLGLVNARWLWQRTGHALVVLMIVAAIITPTGDAFTMLVFTAPLMALYLLSIGVVWGIQRRGGNKTAT